MHGWALEDEAVGSFDLHGIRRPQPDCDVRNGCLERFCANNSGHLRRHHVFTNIQDEMNVPPNDIRCIAAKRSEATTNTVG